MASFIFDKARQAFMEGGIDLSSDSIQALLVRTSGGGGTPYSPDAANDEFLDDVPANAYARVGSAVGLASKTTTDGIFDAADITFSAVAAGDAIQAILLYKETGVEATSRLIALINDYTGFPYTPSGADLTVTWPSTTNKIFKL